MNWKTQYRKKNLFFPHLSIGLIKFLPKSSLDFYRNRQVCSKNTYGKAQAESGKINLENSYLPDMNAY